MKHIYTYLLDQLEDNNPVVIATIIETKGSTPQVQGASAIFGKNGLILGTLGGGILEADAQKRSSVTLHKKESQLYEFDLDAGINTDNTALCGGKALIIMDARPSEHIHSLREFKKSIGDRRPGIFITLIGRLKNGKAELIRYWIDKHILDCNGLNPELSGYRDHIQKCMEAGQPFLLRVDNRSSFGEVAETLLYLEPVFPSPMLIIAGAGHVGQALAHLGSLLDFEITMIDDRQEYCNKNRIPDADHFIVDDIGNAIRDIVVNTDTYIVIVTRGHRNDAEALSACMHSEAAYIGMIGSRRKIRLIREKFLSEGWATASQFDRVHAPIGLEIGSKTVQEIAVSICAQLIQTRYHKQMNKKKAVINSIILAAGESRRMGKPKLIMPFGESTMIDAVIHEAIHSELNQIIVVLGADREKIMSQIKDYPVIIAENPDFHHGMLSSVQCGLRVLPDNTDAVMVLLGDQPMIPVSVINNMIDEYRHANKGIAVAVHNGVRGHPLVFNIKYKPEVEKLNSDHSLKDLTRKHKEDILEVEVGTPVILRDIDTPEDYAKELKYRRLT